MESVPNHVNSQDSLSFKCEQWLFSSNYFNWSIKPKTTILPPIVTKNGFGLNASGKVIGNFWVSNLNHFLYSSRMILNRILNINQSHWTCFGLHKNDQTVSEMFWHNQQFWLIQKCHTIDQTSLGHQMFPLTY